MYVPTKNMCCLAYLADAGGGTSDEDDLTGEILWEEIRKEGVAGLEEVVRRVGEQEGGNHGGRRHPVEHVVHQIHRGLLFSSLLSAHAPHEQIRTK
jgi:hypothetical protein